MKNRLGLHVRLYASLSDVIDRVRVLGIKKAQIFLMTQDKKYIDPSDEEIVEFKEALQQLDCELIVHAGYWSHIVDVHSRGFKTLLQEVSLAEKLGSEKIVIHPGACKDVIDAHSRIDQLSKAVDILLHHSDNLSFLFENISHKGRSFSGSLHEYKLFFARFAEEDRVQMCFDTAHAYAYGYDLKNDKTLQDVFGVLDAIGAHRIGLIHGNDTKNGLGSYLDEHAIPGQGALGMQPLLNFVQNNLFQDVSVIMELPEMSVEEEQHVLQSIINLSK